MDLSKLGNHYSNTYNQFGFNSQGADWGDQDRHDLRLSSMITSLGLDKFKDSTLLDVGCGYGHSHAILDLLVPNNNCKYIGFDPCASAINYAKGLNLPNATFIQSDIQSFSLNHQVDIVFCCGVFTKKALMSDAEMLELFRLFLSLINKLKTSHVCFNFMSPFCDRFAPDLYYPSIEDIASELNTLFGYSIANFNLSNKHLSYEMICSFSLIND